MIVLKILLKIIGVLMIVFGIIGCAIIVSSIDWENYKTYKGVSDKLTDEALDKAFESNIDYTNSDQYDEVFGAANLAKEKFGVLQYSVTMQVLLAISVFFAGLVPGIFAFALAMILSIVQQKQIPAPAEEQAQITLEE